MPLGDWFEPSVMLPASLVSALTMFAVFAGSVWAALRTQTAAVGHTSRELVPQVS